MPVKEAPIDLTNFDFSVSPKDSFFRYVNGCWLAKNKIPAEYPTWNTFTILHEESKENLKVMFDDLLKDGSSSLLAEFYIAAMNEAAIEEAGLSPISNDVNDVDAIDTLDSFFILTAKLGMETLGNCFWYTYVGADDRNSSMNTLMLGQSGLGLPTRDYYFEESKADKVADYKKYIAKIFAISGASLEEAEAKSEQVYALEKLVAEITIPPAELRDPVKCYNKKTLAELQAIAPTVNWKLFFETCGLQVTELVLHNVEYFEKLSGIIASTSLTTLKDYLKFNLISSAASLLYNELVQAKFEFFSKSLQGVQELQPRWKRATGWAGILGDLISEIYVEKHFSKESKKAAADMVNYIIKAFEQRFDEIEWMSPETREKAKLKLSTFIVKIGYPDKWQDYSSLEGKVLQTNPLLTNYRYCARFDTEYQYSFYNKPVDKLLWMMPPYMVNAYYNPSGNEIVFPAAILQPPFFYPPTPENPEGHPALSFGSIGAVIAHEISHGYDDQGAQYDHEGNLKNWWTETDEANFKVRTKAIEDQFNEYTYFGEQVNGKLTAGENIADLGGISIAFKALQLYLKDHPQSKPFTDRFSHEQEFFISWAQGWRDLITKETAVMRVKSDPHSPNEFRTDGPLANFAEFHRAFGVEEGDRMFRSPEKQIGMSLESEEDFVELIKLKLVKRQKEFEVKKKQKLQELSSKIEDKISKHKEKYNKVFQDMENRYEKLVDLVDQRNSLVLELNNQQRLSEECVVLMKKSKSKSRVSNVQDYKFKILILSIALRLVFLVYGYYQDQHPVIKYTDIDYSVFTDASQYVANNQSPYLRKTYRYTPLLAWLLVPNVYFIYWGKILFCICDLIVGMILYDMAGLWSLFWLVNPFVIVISTRGNAESVLLCLVFLVLHYLKK
ncbi:hypothetical protein HDV04_000034 [Boothiomyces sp. JEL0838]|nr:hypothetical protein HDV04_000034 [Boothiomyces sp. JEL0838]